MEMTSPRGEKSFVLEVSVSTGILWGVAGIPYNIVTETTVCELFVYSEQGPVTLRPCVAVCRG